MKYPAAPDFFHRGGMLFSGDGQNLVACQAATGKPLSHSRIGSAGNAHSRPTSPTANSTSSLQVGIGWMRQRALMLATRNPRGRGAKVEASNFTVAFAATFFTLVRAVLTIWPWALLTSNSISTS